MGKSYHHGDLRQALITATLDLIQEDQVHLIGFRELARRLDVSRTAPYRHFESVEQLLVVVVEEGFRKFIAALDKVSGDAALSGKQRIIALGVAYVEFALEHSAHYRLMFEPQRPKAYLSFPMTHVVHLPSVLEEINRTVLRGKKLIGYEPVQIGRAHV